MEIKIYGPGCAFCDKIQKIVGAAVAAKDVEATIRKVTDFQEIAQLGIFQNRLKLKGGWSHKTVKN